MNYPTLLRKLHWTAAALLLVLGYPTAGWAQGGAGSNEAQFQKKLEREEQELAAIARAAKQADVIDRAVAIMGLSELEVETYNYGTLTGGNFGSSFRFPNVEGNYRNYMYDLHIAMAFEEGPWHANAMVHENYQHDYARYDWEAADGSRGNLYADPPVYTYGFPTFAISDLDDTWPATGWPAPEDVQEVWYSPPPPNPPVMWNKWERAGDRNAYGEFTDQYADREGDGLSKSLGIEAKYRAIAYAAANIVFCQYEFTNTSDNDYTNVYIGGIADTGGPSTSDASGYLCYDETNQVIWSRHRSFNPSTGTHVSNYGQLRSFVGTMFLESPTGSLRKDDGGAYFDSPNDVVTRVAFLPWSFRVDRTAHGEEALYGSLSGDVTYMGATEAEIVWKTTLPGGPIMKQSSADMIAMFSDEEDPFFYASSGPFDFPAHSSVNFVVAAVAGYDEPGMFEAADKAINIYNAQFAGPGPPLRPDNFQANGVLAGPHHREFNDVIHDYQIYYTPSGSITLTWDVSEAVATPDAASGIYDFEGIRIYRSIDRGDTWGTQTIDSQGMPGSWIPLIQWDLANGITGEDGMSDKYLGDDTGLVSSFTDTDIIDGIEYWYAITSYDRGEFAGTVQTLESLESTRGDDPAFPTLIAVIAGSRPGGYVEGMMGSGANAGSQLYVYNEGAPEYEPSIYVEVVRDGDITGDNYSISLTDFVIDAVGDTTYSITHTSARGDEQDMTGITLRNTSTNTVLFESWGSASSIFSAEDNMPITEGFRVVANDANNGNYGVYDFSEVPHPDSSSIWIFYRDMQPYYRGSLERVILHQDIADYELRFTGVTDAAGDTNSAICPDTATPSVVKAPFEVWNITTNTRVWPVVPWWYNTPDWDHGWERVIFTNVPYADDFFDTGTYPDHDPANATYWSLDEDDPENSQSDWLWMFEFDLVDPNSYYLGETWRMITYKPLAADLSLSAPFTSTAPSNADSLLDYDDIQVVPNPYFITARWDQTINRRKIQFTNIPPNSTIDIYTLSGELVASLDHGDNYMSSSIGTVDWNIWTYEYTEAAYGLYIYVVKTEGKGVVKVGKFAIIR